MDTTKSYYGCYYIYDMYHSYMKYNKINKFWKCKKFNNEKEATEFTDNQVQSWQVKDKTTGNNIIIINGRKKVIVTNKSTIYFDKIKLMRELNSMVKFVN
jgi:hypothetical protein